MNGEILSIETTQKIALLEKEIKGLSDVIKDAYEYVDKRLLCAEVRQEEILKNILAKGLNKGGEVDAKNL